MMINVVTLKNEIIFPAFDPQKQQLDAIAPHLVALLTSPRFENSNKNIFIASQFLKSDFALKFFSLPLFGYGY